MTWQRAAACPLLRRGLNAWIGGRLSRVAGRSLTIAHVTVVGTRREAIV